MLKWVSKMRPPFWDDLGKETWRFGGRGEPTRESYASQVPEESEGSCLLKNTPVPPLTGGGGFPCRALMIRAVPNIQDACGEATPPPL